MSTPTVCLSEAALRILQELAEQSGQTMMDILDKAIEAYRRQMFFEQLNAAYAELRADPQAWAEVEAERASMAGSLMDGLDPAECWGEDGDLLPPGARKSNG